LKLIELVWFERISGWNMEACSMSV